MPPSPPILVYLDSSDFSVLSDPKKQSPEIASTRERLIELSDSGSIEVWFSSAHIVEMSPLDVAFASAASARADLLVRLCRRNALVSPESLVSMEASRLVARGLTDVDAYSRSGDWFPKIGDIWGNIDWTEQVSQIDDDIRQAGGNRAARRKVHQKLLKGKSLRKAARGSLRTGVTPSLLSEIMRKYPMREVDARVLAERLLGYRTEEQAKSAFLESLRDPRWMTKWFANNMDTMSAITDWLRQPSRTMCKRTAEIAATMQRLRNEADSLRKLTQGAGANTASLPRYDEAYWLNQKERLICQISKSVFRSLGLGDIDGITADGLERFSPGFSTCMRVALDSIWQSTTETGRTPKPSDFIDCVHALYAPYVDIYRTDSYMAPLVAKRTKGYGTTVVSRLSQLIPLVEKWPVNSPKISSSRDE